MYYVGGNRLSSEQLLCVKLLQKIIMCNEQDKYRIIKIFQTKMSHKQLIKRKRLYINS